MKKILVFLLLIFCTHLYSQNYLQVEAGIGVDDIVIGQSDIKEIRQVFGKRYKVKKSWRVACGLYRCMYSTHTWVQYKNGISFIFYEEEAPRGKKRVQGELIAIEIDPPFNAETTNGIRLKETSFKELMDMRGGAKKISIKKAKLIAIYDGIEFFFEAQSASHKNLSYTDFLDSPLIRIAITK